MTEIIIKIAAKLAAIFFGETADRESARHCTDSKHGTKKTTGGVPA
jgi:hypothetical protein